MGKTKHRRFLEQVAYHIKHLENRRRDVSWQEVTPDMVAKYNAFAKQCMEDYLQKM